MKSTSRRGKLLFIIMSLMVLLWIMPIYSCILTAFKPFKELVQGNFWGFPKEFYLGNFVRVWSGLRLGRCFLNSFIIAIPATLGILFLSSLGAYALSMYKFKGNEFILIVFIAFNAIPQQMFLIPVYRLTKILGLYNNYLGVIFYHMAFETGFCVFFLRNFMRSIPSAILDAARIDGISEFGLCWKIVVPLTKPALLTLGILSFTWVWNDFLWSFTLLRNNDLRPITAGLQLLSGVGGQGHITPWGVQNAGILIAVVVPLLLFMFLQKHFTRGLTMGAVK